MSETTLSTWSIDELMTRLRHNKERLNTDDRMQPMSYATIKILQQENRDIKTELNSRYGGKQYEI